MLRFIACYRTGGHTVLLGLVIPGVFVLFQNRPRFAGISSGWFHIEFSQAAKHLFFIALSFLVALLMQYNPISGNLYLPHMDHAYYARLCESLDVNELKIPPSVGMFPMLLEVQSIISVICGALRWVAEFQISIIPILSCLYPTRFCI